MKLSDIKRFMAGGRILRLVTGGMVVWELVKIKKTLLITSSQNFTVPAGCSGLTVTVIGAGGHGGAGGGMTMWGGTGGTGAKVIRVYNETELKSLPQTIGIVVGVATGGTGGSSSFNGEVIANGGGGGGAGGFGYNGANGANGGGSGGTVIVGASAADRTFNGTVYGSGGGGTQGGGSGNSGSNGCVYLEWEAYE